MRRLTDFLYSSYRNMIDRHANKRMTDSLRLMQEIQQDTFNKATMKRKPLKEGKGSKFES